MSQNVMIFGKVPGQFVSLPCKITDNADGTGLLNVSAAAAASELHLGEVGGRLVSVTASFTRPNNATAYAALDVVGDSTAAQTFTSAARVSGGSGYIVGALLRGDNVTTPTARYRLHVYNSAVPTVITDNAAFTLLWADRAKYLGYIDFPAIAIEGAGSTVAQAVNSSVRLPFVTSGNANLFGQLEVLDAQTATANSNFDIKLLLDQN